MCRLMIFNKFGKFSRYFIKYFFLFLSVLFSFWDSHYTHVVCFLMSHKFLRVYSFLFIFFFLLKLDNHYWLLSLLFLFPTQKFLNFFSAFIISYANSYLDLFYIHNFSLYWCYLLGETSLPYFLLVPLDMLSFSYLNLWILSYFTLNLYLES